MQQAIITSIRARVRGDENRIKSPCLGVAWAKDRQSLLGYAFGNTRNFLQIYLAMPSLLPKVNRVASFLDLRVFVRSSETELLLAVMPIFVASGLAWLGMEVLPRSDLVQWLLHTCVPTAEAHFEERRPVVSSDSCQVKTLLADGVHVAGFGQLCASTSYESNVPFVLRFMVRPS